jgi:hypothetical protein
MSSGENAYIDIISIDPSLHEYSNGQNCKYREQSLPNIFPCPRRLFLWLDEIFALTFFDALMVSHICVSKQRRTLIRDRDTFFAPRGHVATGNVCGLYWQRRIIVSCSARWLAAWLIINGAS